MKKNIIKPYKEKNPKNQKETEQIFHSNEKKKKTNSNSNSNSEEEKVVAFFFFFFFTAKMNGGPSGFSTFIHLPYSIFHTLLFFSFFIVNFCYKVFFGFRFALKPKFKCFIMCICHSKCSCYKGFHHRFSAFHNLLWDPGSFQHFGLVLSGTDLIFPFSF